MRIVPLGDKLVVKRAAPERPEAGGIVLPDSAVEAPHQGRVLSVGDGRLLPNGKRSPHDVREGDRVVFGRYAGAEVAIDGEKLLVLSADDLLAIIH